jgi:hypothetical protein
MLLEGLATLDLGSERVHGDCCHSVSPLVLLAPKRLINGAFNSMISIIIVIYCVIILCHILEDSPKTRNDSH